MASFSSQVVKLNELLCSKILNRPPTSASIPQRQQQRLQYFPHYHAIYNLWFYRKFINWLSSRIYGLWNTMKFWVCAVWSITKALDPTGWSQSACRMQNKSKPSFQIQISNRNDACGVNFGCAGKPLESWQSVSARRKLTHRNCCECWPIPIYLSIDKLCSLRRF